MTREVVLVPGLWMPATAMKVLGARLSRSGYRPWLFDYQGRRSFEDNIQELARFARDNLGGRPAHFVGHSLGGVLVLETLNRHEDVPAASAVLLGAPVRGSRSGRKLARARVGRWMMGACQALWEPHPAAWRRQAPLGVIAGSRPLGLGRLLGRLPETNDGVVCLEETWVDGMTACAVVPQGHSMLIFSRHIGELVARFLATGRFD